MSQYKLYSFNAFGLIRYIFTQAGEKYEDIRLVGEQWPEFKPSESVIQVRLECK